jgi:hypothetical protein
MASTRKSKRKTKHITVAQWDSLDQLFEKREITMSASAREKLNNYGAWERQQAAVMRAKLKLTRTDEFAPLVVDRSRDADDILEIGRTLLDEFDPSTLDLTTTIDPSVLHMDHIDRAPGVTDEQLMRYDALIRFNLPPSFHAIKMETVTRLLTQVVVTASQAQTESQLPREEVIEFRCFIPLMWFVEQLNTLPFMLDVKNLYLDEAKLLALRTPSGEFRRVWKHVIVTHNRLKQDLADYLWYASQSEQRDDDEAEEGPVAKQPHTSVASRAK